MELAPFSNVMQREARQQGRLVNPRRGGRWRRAWPRVRLQASSLGSKAQPREIKQANGRKLAEFNKKHGTGAQRLPLERKQELARQNFALQTLEQKQANAAKQHLQRWRCLVTGYETTPAPLSRYQKARGIDTLLRERVGAG